ncbi:MAG TPA: NHL repeat-containing protein [Candidatus Acidoferrales bacterium]|jgi:hypothetical protein|nr:NHL repeat-containing protein [Candidatus Acidoferrales bacterium]
MDRQVAAKMETGAAGVRRRGGVSFLMVIPLLAFAGALGGCSQTETRAQTQAPPRFSITYIATWGVRGSDPGQLEQPTDIATDSLGNIYLADAGSRYIDKFTWEGRPLLSFGEPGLKYPQAITVDSGGAIYLTDVGRSSTFVFFPNGDRYHEVRLKTRPNDENLLGVAVGEDGLMHVLDADAGHVFTYTSRFRLLRNWQPAANMPNGKGKPRAIAVGPDGYLYFVDPVANQILRFTNEGQFTSLVDPKADGVDRRLSDQFAVGLGYIFAMDVDGRMLHVWTVDGRPKLDVDLAPELGQANRAAPSLAVSPRKELLVLDRPEARVLRYRLNF